MIDLMRKGFSFLSFDFYELNVQRQCSDCSTAINFPANRWLLISHYWFKKVPLHFLAMLLLAWLSLTVINPGKLISLPVVIVSAFAVFLLQIFFLYLPLFMRFFLPAMYELQQKEINERVYETEKCKKAQLPNTTLVLILFALTKTAGLESLKNKNDYSELLTQLFGVDQRSIKSTIDLFWGSAQKRNKLQGRARTEIENRFSEAYNFCEALGFEKGISHLKELEVNFFSKVN